MPRKLKKNARTYTEKQAEIEARDLRWAGYKVSKYKVKTGEHKGRYRLHLSEDKDKRGRKHKPRPRPSGRDSSV